MTTATATIEAINKNVGGFVSQHLEPVVERDDLAELIRVVDSIDAVPSHLIKSDNDKRDAVGRAVAHYLSQRIARVYPVVSRELIRRRRWLKFEVRRGRGWTLVGESLTKPENVKENGRDEGGAFSVLWHPVPLLMTTERDYRENWSSVSLTGFGSHHIMAQEPAMPSEAEACRRQATALVMESIADALRIDRIGHIVEPMVSGEYRHHIEAPKCRIAWVPLLSELELKKAPPDPALLMSFHGYMHLVTHWDAPGERPIEAILREYTAGGAFPPALDNA